MWFHIVRWKKISEIQDEILELLKKISRKIDKVGSMRESAPAPAAKAATPAKPAAGKVTIEETSYVKPSEVVQKQVEAEKAAKGDLPPPTEGRKTCQKCGSFEFNTVEDKTKPLHYVSGTPIYAKKSICKKCGAEVPWGNPSDHWNNKYLIPNLKIWRKS